MPLGQHQLLPSPVTLTDIRSKRQELLTLRERIQSAAGGQPIYFPCIPYQDTLRTFQSYLVRMPREAISLFPELRAAVREAEARSATLGAASAVQQAEEAVSQAAGKAASAAKSQGFQVDQEAKVAVEAHAMNIATEHYAAAWQVRDVHGNQSYDLECRRGDEVKHVEVKGTTTDGNDVILTPGEVRHAREHEHNALFILSNVTIQRSADGTVEATGGAQHIHDPWHLDDAALTPIGFRYQVP